MPFYQNSVIYKLCHLNDLDNENIYIGSTTNFKNRKHDHKVACNNKNGKRYNFKVYQFIRDNGGWNEWQMIPIESFSCNNKIELEIRERYHIELLKSKLNCKIPTRNRKEYYNDNKEQILNDKKIYGEENRDKIKYAKKKHREDNIDEYKKKDKIYYENNKEKKNEKAKAKIVCEKCGCEINKNNLKRHQKTKKCIDYI
jgi:hypothetical protein